MEKHIFLNGFMGAGKSKIGPYVAKKFACSFFDTDKIIEREEGKNISEIFENVPNSHKIIIFMPLAQKWISFKTQDEYLKFIKSIASKVTDGRTDYKDNYQILFRCDKQELIFLFKDETTMNLRKIVLYATDYLSTSNRQVKEDDIIINYNNVRIKFTIVF